MLAISPVPLKFSRENSRERMPVRGPLVLVVQRSGLQASALYETHASTLWTLVVKERSLTSSELAMYRGSLSSHAWGTSTSLSV